jgi:chromosome segregation ATPase
MKMAGEDDNLAALIQKIKEDEIEKKVYTKIRTDLLHLKFAGAVGLLIVFLLAAFREPILSYVVSSYGDALKTKIVEGFQPQIEQSASDLKRMEGLRDAIHKQGDFLLQDIIAKQTDVARIRAELDQELNDVKEQITNLEAEREKIIQAESDATTAGESAKGNAEQIQNLIDKYNSIAKVLSDKGTLPEDVAKPIQQTVNASPTIGEKGTAYFQFAGGLTRKQAQEISAEIQKLGWNIPGEERTPSAVRTNKVRFSAHHPSDRQKADGLRDDVDTALQKLHIAVSPIETQESKTLKPGILEISIYLP